VGSKPGKTQGIKPSVIRDHDRYTLWSYNRNGGVYEALCSRASTCDGLPCHSVIAGGSLCPDGLSAVADHGDQVPHTGHAASTVEGVQPKGPA